MKLRPHQSPFLGLLLISPFAVVLSNPAADSSPAVSTRGNAVVHRSGPILQRRTTQDAPVDGKDGKPHQGPFVETSGDREANKEKTLVSEEDSDPGSAQGKPLDTTVDEYGNKIPESNDGVMDDKERSKAKEGTTGTEGGVSERERQRKEEEARTGEKSEGSPISPEEKPPLPHSEEEKMKAKGIDVGSKEDKAESEKSKDANQEDTLGGLEKPDDLPEVPHDKSNPIPNSAVKDHLDVNSGSHSSSGSSAAPLPLDDESGLIQPLHSFVLSYTMIIVSEIGDKTFLVAALMAMKHDRMVVFSAAFAALITMTVLSAVLGHALPTLIPKSLTNFAAAVLFLGFGAKLLKEGMDMSPDEGVADEMHEVEREISEKESEARRNGTAASVYAMEAGYARKPRSKSRLNSPPRSPSSSPDSRHGGGRGKGAGAGGLKGAIDGIHNLTSFLLSPAWVQTFVMTFLGEWGDRSQIATIAMAAGQDYWWVTLGAVLGHMCCTGVAVLGGRAIAGKVSMKVVTIGGAIAFLVFGVIYLVEGFYS
ncbi:UPF0016-domain-containing protein [Zalerion maritima]|uniref:UPF0016-domain-containing protein n=1 Tax=Zalerion maritima TaxID=339359 RepID=A0AAD5RL20_9PEZI|nr:UPF0016-domain-containing protein [Zalerion maritima]